MIKMLAGVYGLHIKNADGTTRVKAMGPNDGPFAIDPEKEARLVSMGVACYVGGQDKAPEEVVPEVPELPELPEDVVPIPEYHTGMTAKELREIGKLCGLTFKVGMSKEEMVSTLDAHIAENTVDPDEAEPEDAEEVVPEEEAPVFDAAEAVL